jgi:hypothetical protein
LDIKVVVLFYSNKNITYQKKLKKKLNKKCNKKMRIIWIKICALITHERKKKLHIYEFVKLKMTSS